tara:strand:- start:40918 stop:42009 length:1092 start_codon:yes stop_codon:yes gene_type:complete
MQQHPSFDTWTAGFLIAVAMGLFLSVLLLSTKNKKSYPIAFFVLAFAAILFQYVLYWTGYQYVFPYFIMVPPLCYYLTGPLLYWYFLNLYQKPIPKTFAFHFIPACIVFCIYLLMLFRNTLGTQFSIPFIRLSSNQWFIATHMVAYFLVLKFSFVKLKDATSEFKTIRTNWAKILTWLYGIFILAYLSYYILVNFSFFNDEWDYAISIMMTLSIYTIGYFIFKEPKVFDGEFYAEIFLPNVSKAESLEDQLLDELYKKITTYMVQKKPYMHNELRLANLADQLDFSTHVLSKVINQRSGGNFNNFVNKYRLEAAESLLKEDPAASIKTIYFEVGFNSKAAFYTAFKEKHHCTPLQYRQDIKLS